MFKTIAQKIFGTANDRKLKPLADRVFRINKYEHMYSVLADDALKIKTYEFKARLARGATLDTILPEAFAVVREAAHRSLGMRHFDVQLMGGLVLHNGNIAEMRTGEGKTLVATLPAYLNALTEKGVHVVTVNDYLARRDAEWMGQVYRFLGLTTGTIVSGQTDEERKSAYKCDITYGTNNEFGFDYLRDNMKYSIEEMVQRQHAYAIVDEVDSILIDEARTPLIISGPTDDRSKLYQTIDKLVPKLEEEHFELDEKQKSVVYTEEGVEHMETLLAEAGILEGSLWEPANVSIVHHANQALRAHKLFFRDRDYILKNRQVMLIDEFTGRMMEGRRLSDGLHQAIEAKERVDIKPENQTLASITFQNYFRLYDKLAGMTGTAMTEAAEFFDIYKLDVVDLPPNREVKRHDDDDVVYRTASAKYKDIVADVKDAKERGQPVLLGTASIEKSELISDLLEKEGVPHKVLNARHHEQEAQIIADAGVPGAITVATNMAGRGTDIQLGGNLDMRFVKHKAEFEEQNGREMTAEEVQNLRSNLQKEISEAKEQALKAGGLYVLGTERHESRRIDNQLRGRTGRQGDPGKTKFFISIEDDLMRIFVADRLESLMGRLGIEEEGITHPWMNKAMETAQGKIEQRNFEARKNVLKYDDVINDQRKVIFEQRKEFMSSESVTDMITQLRHDMIDGYVSQAIPEKAYAEQWDIKFLKESANRDLGIDLPLEEWAAEEGVANAEIKDRIIEASDKAYKENIQTPLGDNVHSLEKQVLLQVIDLRWREHLQQIDQLRSVIHLRGYGQRNPLNEFKEESFSLYHTLMEDLRTTVTRTLMNLRVEIQEGQPPAEAPLQKSWGRNRSLASGATARGNATNRPTRPPPRNAPCPCGSGKKYKHCCGALANSRKKI